VLQHFLGMNALTLKHPVTREDAMMEYRPLMTTVSLLAPVLCFRAGFQVMQKDCFAKADRGNVLREMLHANTFSIAKSRSAEVSPLH
jgi:NO-binding membrane sensor protein with MHYT domain